MATSRADRELLVAFLADDDVVARWCALVHPVPMTSGCLIWAGALSKGGHGRFWVGARPDGRSMVMIAHRFGYALNHGIDALYAAAAIRHLCDEPSCQNPEHWRAGTVQDNTIEWANRRHTPGSPLRDTRGPYGRAQALRAAARAGRSIDEAASAGTPIGDFLQDALPLDQVEVLP